MSRAMTLLVVLIVAMFLSSGTAMVFELERVQPSLTNHTVGKAVDVARDQVRHARLFGSRIGIGTTTTSSGAANFDVWTLMESFGPGLYFTRVTLGTPPRDYSVHMDTGSDLLWVSCSSCSTCPHSSLLVPELHFFDTATSTTSHQIVCSEPLCPKSSHCSDANRECGYSVHYADESGTTGSYVSDLFHLRTISANLSASVVFGCSTDRVGRLTNQYEALDGIFGLGRQSSVVVQLASISITPWAFSHCLRGSDIGGGILALGEILYPSIVYTPLLPSQPHYNVRLEGISINGQPLPIDQAVFGNSHDRGAVVDSGSTFAYLPKEAYDPFVDEINTAVSQSVTLIISEGIQCYLVSMSVSDLFPHVSLNFEGGASMVLKAEEYLKLISLPVSPSTWCITFQRSEDGLTILGDQVLKDKIVVYDLGRQRVGWANYNCSLPVNVSVTFGNGEPSFSSSEQHFLFQALVLQCLFLLVHQLIMG